MRTRFFVAFLVVIAMALLSNVIFRSLIVEDFEEYARSGSEDQLYLVLAAVEGSRMEEGTWDHTQLMDAVHWAAMLGHDVEVRDQGGAVLLATNHVLRHLSPAMKRRMDAIVDLDAPVGEFEDYPLYSGGEEIGTLRVRPLIRRGLQVQKEAIFKRRVSEFLGSSFVIAGGGAIFLAVALSMFLSMPIRRLRQAAARVASGDLSVRINPTNAADEIGQLGRSFDQMVESLEREEAIRKRLTANIAHELRTPLTVMRTQIEAISDGVIAPTPETIDTLAGEVHRLVRLVEGIEDITRAEASIFKQPLNECIELASLMDGIAQAMSVAFGRKGLTLELSGPDIDVVSDAEKLEVIIRNLLNNALQHVQHGKVSVSWGPQAGGFFFKIGDTGSGIPPEELPMLFKRFFKGSSSSGTGIGLSIVQELLDALGGKIEVESELGKGTTFTVRMPLKEPD